MKTSIKRLAGVAFMATSIFFFSGCEKLSQPSVPVKKHKGTETSKVIHCDPWRNVTGWSALISEMNSLALCDVRMCTGNSVTLNATNWLLSNSSTGSLYLFTSSQVITPAEQNSVMNDAIAWAVANTPSGYFVSSVSYSPNIIVGGGSTSAITVNVVYRKCTGGGGGGES